MMNGLNSYQLAYSAANFNNFVAIEDSEQEIPGTEIESSIVRKDLFDHLSQEAAMVAEVIFSCPAEICNPKHNGVNKRLLHKYLRCSLHFSPKLIRRTFKELAKVAEEL